MKSVGTVNYCCKPQHRHWMTLSVAMAFGWQILSTAQSSSPVVAPTFSGVSYGSEPNQFVDFYQASSTAITPVIVYIHGGGWSGGSASGIVRTDVFGKNNRNGEGVRKVLASGVSIVSVEYRLLTTAHKSGIKPPVKWPLSDAARAIQFIRSKADEWKIDKERIGLTGSSAGGCSSLWLAMHDDLADLKSGDPIERESSRPSFVGIQNAQSSLDPEQLQHWFKSPSYGAHAFGFFKLEGKREISDMAACLAERERILPWIKEYSPIEHASKDDPELFLNYSAAPQGAGQPQIDSVHGAMHGIKLKEKLDLVGGRVTVTYPGMPGWSFDGHINFLLARLKQTGSDRDAPRPVVQEKDPFKNP